MKYEPGDVVTYSGRGEAIVASSLHDHVLLEAWRDSARPERWITTKGGILPKSACQPCLEADRVRAEYTAWRLTQ